MSGILITNTIISIKLFFTEINFIEFTNIQIVKFFYWNIMKKFLLKQNKK
jgi:hypothetical protein